MECTLAVYTANGQYSSQSLQQEYLCKGQQQLSLNTLIFWICGISLPLYLSLPFSLSLSLSLSLSVFLSLSHFLSLSLLLVSFSLFSLSLLPSCTHTKNSDGTNVFLFHRSTSVAFFMEAKHSLNDLKHTGRGRNEIGKPTGDGCKLFTTHWMPSDTCKWTLPSNVPGIWC